MLELVPGRLFNFLRREGSANSKGGAYLKGALISFINFWPENENYDF